MCNPIAIAAVSAVSLSAASMGMQAYGSYQSAQAENKANKYNAQIQQRNAEIANMQAEDAIARGEEDARTHLKKVNLLKGEQRASMGASGVTVDEGSSMDVLLDTTEQGTLDALTIKRNAARNAWGYRNQAGNYTAQGNLYTLNKKNAAFSAGTTLLTGASSLMYQSAMLARGRDNG